MKFGLAITALFSAGAFSRKDQSPLIQHEDSNDGNPQLLEALDTMQTQFFETWQGTWPDAIDWTRAVMGTHLAAGAHTYSKSGTPGEEFSLQNENVVNAFFSHLIAFYFGQDHFALRLQAYDDMLWVVLGWLDTIQLSNHHSEMHWSSQQGSIWYGNSFSPAFAHRARLFWESASYGWDEKLCGGGMIWSPWLTPYKNAITNELYIAASINMYLYFPGDDNDFPFLNIGEQRQLQQEKPWKPHEKKYLDAAIKSYNWLLGSKMMDSQGLFFDGFHIHGWSQDGIGSGKCDVPDKKVYTYNQGVILSAQRGLWSATGNTSYLSAGHELIQNVISATGWSLETNTPPLSSNWSGLGRKGVLEEACDSGGYCSQDGQTFKGIFFHHLTEFCAPLPTAKQHPQPPFHPADKDTAALHLQSCLDHAPWVERNADAALGTRNENGVFGMWWTIGLAGTERWNRTDGFTVPQDEGDSVDYRNQGVPDDKIWRLGDEKSARERDRFARGRKLGASDDDDDDDDGDAGDPNERGRGRTVETHSGGVAVLRARDEFRALRNVRL